MIDRELAITSSPATKRVSWEANDVILYNLALGFGMRDGDSTNPDAMRYTQENRLTAVPSFAAILGHLNHVGVPEWQFPGVDVPLRTFCTEVNR